MCSTIANVFLLCIGALFAVNAQADEKVNLQYVREMKATGLRGLDVDDIIKLAEAGVSPQYVREMKAMGMRHFDADDAIKLAQEKIEIAYAKAAKANNLRHFDANDVLKLHRAGVSHNYLGEMRNAGANHLRYFDANDMIVLHKAGVPAQYVKDTCSIGLRHFDANDVVKLHKAHLPAKFVREAKTIGSRDANDVIRLASKTGHHTMVIHKRTHTSPSHFVEKATNIATVVGLILLVGFMFFTVQKKRNQNVVQADDVEVRLTRFEHRVNDLQDILLSIDDRLDRRLKRT